MFLHRAQRCRKPAHPAAARPQNANEEVVSSRTEMPNADNEYDTACIDTRGKYMRVVIRDGDVANQRARFSRENIQPGRR